MDIMIISAKKGCSDCVNAVAAAFFWTDDVAAAAYYFPSQIKLISYQLTRDLLKVYYLDFLTFFIWNTKSWLRIAKRELDSTISGINAKVNPSQSFENFPDLFLNWKIECFFKEHPKEKHKVTEVAAHYSSVRHTGFKNVVSQLCNSYACLVLKSSIIFEILRNRRKYLYL